MLNAEPTQAQEAFRLLPQPRYLSRLRGAYKLCSPRLEIGGAAVALPKIVAEEWKKEFGSAVELVSGADGGFYFFIGRRTPPDPSVGAHPELYTLTINEQGVSAFANTAAGLLYAWQTLKQLMRNNAAEIPSVQITDWPDLRWRVYHLDLKGTRRTLANLHAILPRLAEFKVNAVLAEYEDYVQLDRHPLLAVPHALKKSEVKEWIAAAKAYNVTVVPLVQTLGHLQYVLRHPEYSRLQEKPGDPAEACASHPDTWLLIRDFLDEMMELHEGLPFFHVGLDETFHIGSCPKCRTALKNQPKLALYIGWLNRCCDYVKQRGFAPLVWGDIVSNHQGDPLIDQLNRDAVYVDWGYVHTGPLSPSLIALNRGVSREWLKRPNGEINQLPAVGPCKKYYEDLTASEQSRIKPLVDNPEFPKKFKTDIPAVLMVQAGLKFGLVSGIRVSFHGAIAPRFIQGQLNTLQAAVVCKKHHSDWVIGSSWSRGHSLAGMNAHPELDWYGIATLAAAGWSNMTSEDLRDFDERFGFQFFGLPDGHIGDLLFLFERTSPRLDHSSVNYLPHILEELERLAPLVKRNALAFKLLQTVCSVMNLRNKAQFALLEMEYFYAMWARVPPDFKARMKMDVESTAAAIASVKKELGALYSESIQPEDADELSNTQLDFFRDQMLLMAKQQFPEA